jgi:hypothetical protein
VGSDELLFGQWFKSRFGQTCSDDNCCVNDEQISGQLAMNELPPVRRAWALGSLSGAILAARAR